MRNVCEINEKLQLIQKRWYDNIANPYIDEELKKSKLKESELDESKKQFFSLPFYAGLSDQNASDLPVVMIVGQETFDFWHCEDKKIVSRNGTLIDCTIENLQKKNIDYQNTQFLNNWESEYGNSKNTGRPFWKFIERVYQLDYFPCWNNIDKMHRYKDGKTKPLTEEYERELNKSIDGRSLLMHEIEIIKPDIIICVTGPNYIVSMQTALCDKLKKINKPTLACPWQDITDIVGINIPVFWTYHPKYLQIRKSFESIIDIIKAHKNKT